MVNYIEVGGERVSLKRPVVLKIIERIHEIVEQGAGIIDVGAYSTRPGAEFVDEREELSRLSFAVELVRKYYPHLPVSIDTFRANVAREIRHCLGDVIVNDISGGTMDEKMFETVAEMNVPYILMHIQGTPRDMQVNPHYEDVVGEVRQFLAERIARLNALGFNKIIIDQGFGFGKTLEHNYRLMERIGDFLTLDYPLLVGISRKTMIWKLLGCTPKEALNGTTVLNTIALLKGAHILRVHDVREAVEAVKIVEELKRNS